MTNHVRLPCELLGANFAARARRAWQGSSWRTSACCGTSYPLGRSCLSTRGPGCFAVCDRDFTRPVSQAASRASLPGAGLLLALRARGSHNPKRGFRNPGNVRGTSKQSKVWSAITAQWLLCTNDCWCVQCKMPTVTRLSPFLINTANDHVMVLQGVVDLSQTMPAAKLWCDLWTQLTGQHKTWVGVCTNTHPP